MTDKLNEDTGGIEPVEYPVVKDAGVINQIVKAEIDTAIATARAYPRNITQFRKKATGMACIDADVAGSCFYKLRRQNQDGTAKIIEGPSIRFAEIVGNSYGNLRFGARIVDEGQEFVTAQGIAHDLENNVSVTTEVRRRITTKTGKRYGTDMIIVTANAACAIALRNAIFKAVPFSLAKSVYDQAKKTAVGNATTLNERRAKMIEAFGQMSVTPEMIFQKLGIKGTDDIDIESLEIMLGTFNAIHDGDVTIEEEFGDIGKIEMPTTKDGQTPGPDTSPPADSQNPSPEKTEGKADPNLINIHKMKAQYIKAFGEQKGAVEYYTVLGRHGGEHSTEIPAAGRFNVVSDLAKRFNDLKKK